MPRLVILSESLISVPGILMGGIAGKVQASGKKWDCSGLDQVVRRCFGTKCMVYSDVSGVRSTQNGDNGNAVLLVS